MKLGRVLGVLIIVLAGIAFMGCDLLDLGSDQTGSLQIQFSDNVNARSTLVPDYDMDVVEYRVSGTGPGDREFGPVTVDRDGVTSSYTVEDLFRGEWSISVEALNEDGDVIGVGDASATVIVGETVNAQIEVVPFTGEGRFHLLIEWTQDALDDPNIEVYFTLNGEEEGDALTLNSNGDQVTFIGDFEAGYYDLRVVPKDGDDAVDGFGFARVVRIVSSNTTIGEFFMNIPVDGEVAIGVIDRLNNPFPVTIDPDGLEITDSEIGEFSVTPDGDGYSYTWYLGGVKLAEEESSTLELDGSELGIGWYNVDVRVESPTGALSSGTSWVRVVETPPFLQFTMADGNGGEQEYRLTRGVGGAFEPAGIVDPIDGSVVTGIHVMSDEMYSIVATDSDSVTVEDIFTLMDTGSLDFLDTIDDIVLVIMSFQDDSLNQGFIRIIKKVNGAADKFFGEPIHFVNGDTENDLYSVKGLKVVDGTYLEGQAFEGLVRELNPDDNWKFIPDTQREITVSFKALLVAEL